MFLLSYFQYISLSLVSNLIDREKLSWKKLILLIIVGGTTGYFIGTYLDFNAIFLELPLMVGMFFLFTKKIWNSILRVLSAYIIMIISDHLASVSLFLISNITINKITEETRLSIIQVIISGVAGILIALVINQLLEKASHKMDISQSYIKYGSMLTFLTLVYYYVSISFSQGEGNSPEIILFNAISFIVYFIAVSFILVMVIISVRKAAEVQHEKQQHERLLLYSESLEKMNTEIRKFKHDYLNILSTMSNYITDGDLENLREYFSTKIIPTKDILLESTDTVDSLKNLKVIELKGVLSYKVINAQKQGTKVIIEVPEVIATLNMEEIDLCRSLGIILDNAIEETETQENGQINIGLIKRTQSVIIVVMNTCKEPMNLHQISVNGYSTKGKNRGLGLANFKEIVSRYENIMCATEFKNGCYVQEIEIFDK